MNIKYPSNTVSVELSGKVSLKGLLKFLTCPEGSIFALFPRNFATSTRDDFWSVECERVGGVRLAPHIIVLGERPVGEELVLSEVELEGETERRRSRRRCG